ncbi:DUF2207 domain-containing protein [Sutcliffiella halmapala]|uniref:DUF2207 domain-containing protein n=1 Tax=Sutcliffiella halmapala TaxID=79882 RepID=UPI000994B7B0|nr:DUF2207 domain-containing protein [Sutcliffiella halmapala]
MKLKWFIPTLLLTLFFLLPTQASAVEFSITNVHINAYLQENGNVKIEETHTYQFNGEFNGITRELIPKTGTEIIQLEASENENILKIEKDKTLYRIYRSGEDETITVTIRYTIVNGVDVYPDVSEFYWPFFDKSNKSDYENLSITIHPPQASDKVIAFGYDEAFGKETIASEGIVHFDFGYVSKKENGDIRVVYPSQLFSSAPLASEKLMEKAILQEQEKGIATALNREENRELLSTISSILLPVFAIILGILMTFTWIKARSLKRRILQELAGVTGTPKQYMSLPATILFTNYHLPPQAIAAALLDLVRLGYVKKLSNNSFQLINRNVTETHQDILIKWLFDEIGADNEFSFKNLDEYMKNKKNHTKFTKYQSMWVQAITKEVNERELYEKKTTYRMLIGFSSLILIPFLFFFPVYGLFVSFFFTIVLFLTVIIYAISYRPRTETGARVFLEWSLLKKNFPSLSQDDWDLWTEDEKMRAFIYALGLNEKKMQKKNEKLVSIFQKPVDHAQSTSFSGINITTLILLASIASPGFSTASNTATQSGSSSFSGGGAGAGGGGGGSGAF